MLCKSWEIYAAPSRDCPGSRATGIQKHKKSIRQDAWYHWRQKLTPRPIHSTHVFEKKKDLEVELHKPIQNWKKNVHLYPTLIPSIPPKKKRGDQFLRGAKSGMLVEVLWNSFKMGCAALPLDHRGKGRVVCLVFSLVLVSPAVKGRDNDTLRIHTGVFQNIQTRTTIEVYTTAVAFFGWFFFRNDGVS